MNTIENNWKQQNKLNTTNLGIWTFAWLISLAIATFGPIFLWNEIQILTAGLVLLNVALGLAMIMAHRKYLNGLDELQQKIQLEAMAIALGVAVVLGLAYSLFDITNLIAYDAEISHLVILIGITYKISALIGQYRYK